MSVVKFQPRSSTYDTGFRLSWEDNIMDEKITWLSTYLNTPATSRGRYSQYFKNQLYSLNERTLRVVSKWKSDVGENDILLVPIVYSTMLGLVFWSESTTRTNVLREHQLPNYQSVSSSSVLQVCHLFTYQRNIFLGRHDRKGLVKGKMKEVRKEKLRNLNQEP